MRFELRIYDAESNTYGEAFEHSNGDSIADFEEYVEQYTDECEDAASKPFRDCVAGRDWIDNEGQEISAFAYREDGEFICPRCNGRHFGTVLDPETHEITKYECHSDEDGNPVEGTPEAAHERAQSGSPLVMCGWGGTL